MTYNNARKSAYDRISFETSLQLLEWTKHFARLFPHFNQSPRRWAVGLYFASKPLQIDVRLDRSDQNSRICCSFREALNNI